jgi:hypothetical protein
MNGPPSKADWKKFEEIIPELREKYLKKKNHEIRNILNNGRKSSTENFWAAEKKIQKVVRILEECLDGYSKARMKERILIMYHEGMFLEEDIQHFSEELQEEFLATINRWKS